MTISAEEIATTESMQMTELLEQVQKIIDVEIMRQYESNPAWDEAKDVVENIDCQRIAGAIVALVEPNARIAALEAQLAEREGVMDMKGRRHD